MAGKGRVNKDLLSPSKGKNGIVVDSSQQTPFGDAHSTSAGLGLLQHFHPYKNHFTTDVDLYQSGFYHIFMTKPDLNLLNAFNATFDTSTGGAPAKVTGSDVLKMYELAEAPLMVQLLCYSTTHQLGDNQVFMKPITNLSHNAPLMDTTLRVYEAYENFSGYRMPLGKGTKETRNAQQFQIKYHDTDNLLLMNTHRIWMEYIDKCKKGLIVRSPANLAANKVDYMQSLYVFGLKPDGRTINYWSRYTGVFPTSIPWTGLNMEQGQFQIPEFDIQYSFLYRQEMDDSILKDFAGLVGDPRGGINLTNSDDKFAQGSLKDDIYPTRQAVFIEKDIETGMHRLVFADL